MGTHRWVPLAATAALGLLFAVPALADYLGPNRTVTTRVWRRLHCHYQAVHDPPGTGWYGCTLDLYQTPESACPSGSSVVGYFSAAVCGWPEPYCRSYGCQIDLSTSVEDCRDGESGCRAVEQAVTYPAAAVNGSVSCGTAGNNGWCRGGGALSLSGSEPLSGYEILALEGTRNGQGFACPGSTCALPLPEGSSDFTFWAVSSWGDTSLMGTAGGRQDSQPPVLNWQVSGTAGANGWYTGPVVVRASAGDPAPGSGLWGIESSLDGGAWSANPGPLTIADGAHQLDLRAADAAGNSSAQSLPIPVDSQPPAVSLTAGDGFCPGCGETLAIEIGVQDSLSGVEGWSLSGDEQPIARGVSAAETVVWDGSGLPGGSPVILLEAWDKAGNRAETRRSVALIAATAPPSPRLVPPPTAVPTAGERRPSTVSNPTPSAAQEDPVPAVTTADRPPAPTPGAMHFDTLPAAPPPEGAHSAETGVSGQAAQPAAGPGILWGAGAAAAIASAAAFEAARRQRAALARRRAETERRDDETRAGQQALLAGLTAARAEAEFRLTAGQILHQITGGERPSQAWLAAAEAAAHAAQADWEREAQRQAPAEPKGGGADRVRPETSGSTVERGDRSS